MASRPWFAGGRESVVEGDWDGGEGDALRFGEMDSRVWREVSSVGDWGGGIETGEAISFLGIISLARWGSNMVALQQKGCWCCSSILLLLPDPIVLRCFSNFVTFELVALWRGGGGSEMYGGGGRNAEGGEGLDVSL